MSRIRVVLADDHPVIREFLRRVLQQAPDIHVIGEACDGLQMLSLAVDLEPDVVLLDMEMPGLDGIEVTQRIKEKGLTFPILVISSHNDAQFIIALFRMGIAGYLVKEEAPVHVVKAVRAVANGQQGWISNWLAATVTSSMCTEAPDDELTELDRQVLQMTSHGKTNEEISKSLGLNPTDITEQLDHAVSSVRHNLSQVHM
jgi:DNA-binding NarL/FixJ family response regulator